MKTSTTYLTSLRLKDTPLDRNDRPANGINLQIQKDESGINLLFGYPHKLVDVRGVTTYAILTDWLDYVMRKYNEMNNDHAEYDPREIERLKKLLI